MIHADVSIMCRLQDVNKEKSRARIKQDADGGSFGLARGKVAHVDMSNVGSSEGLPADISNLRAVKLEADAEDRGLAGGGTAPVEMIDLGRSEEEEPVQLLECEGVSRVFVPVIRIRGRSS
jgi:hypothetical protein